MPTRKPVLNVRGLRYLDRHAYPRLQDELIKAVAAIKELGVRAETHAIETDVMVFFQADEYSTGANVHIELSLMERERKLSDRVMHKLAADLGRAVLEVAPRSFVQCEICLGPPDNLLILWTSGYLTTREELKKAVDVAKSLLSFLRDEAATHCYCIKNVPDHMDACKYHKDLVAHQALIEHGERALADTNDPTFETAAKFCLAQVKSDPGLAPLRRELEKTKTA